MPSRMWRAMARRRAADQAAQVRLTWSKFRAAMGGKQLT